MAMRSHVRAGPTTLRQWQWQRHQARFASMQRPARNAQEAAAVLVDAFADRVSIRTEMLDRNQLRKLALTLNRPIWPSIDPRSEIPKLQIVPPGYHLIYFTGGDVEENLAPDGSDRTFNPPRPFTRRMWAGGRIIFEREHLLRTDAIVEEHTRLVGATVKRNKAGEEMLLVEVEKRYFYEGHLCVTDSRSWLFRNALPLEGPDMGTRDGAQRISDGDPTTPSSCERLGVEKCSAHEHMHPVWQLSWSPVGLFRFSALTFNGHKIHYNEDWTRTREGHSAPVVHGPLNLITLLDYWAEVHGQRRPGLGVGVGVEHGTGPREVVYRALSPVHAGEKYCIRTDGEAVMGEGIEKGSGKGSKKRVDVLAEREGMAIMKASIWG